jgi:protein CpxP
MIRQIRSRTVIAAAVVAILAALAGVVHAQGDGPRGRGGFGRGSRVGFPLAALDLTEAQREQVRGVMQSHREAMQEAGKRLRDAHVAQRNAVETVPVNEGLVRSTSQTLANAQTDMALLQARIHSEVWALLTPEQQQKAKELKAEREARVKQRASRRQPQRQG